MQFDDITREAVEVIQSVQGYSTVRLIDIFNIKFNGKKDVFGRKDIIENGYSAIFFSDISRRYDVKTENIKSRISKELFEISNKMRKNDILVSLEEFSKKHTGRAVLYCGVEEVALNGHVAVMSLKESFMDMVNLEYLSFYMNYSDFFRKQVLKNSTGAKVQRISKEIFQEMEIVIPRLEAQDRAVIEFKLIKKGFKTATNNIKNRIEKITATKEFIMQEIFNKMEEIEEEFLQVHHEVWLRNMGERTKEEY